MNALPADEREVFEEHLAVCDAVRRRGRRAAGDRGAARRGRGRSRRRRGCAPRVLDADRRTSARRPRAGPSARARRHRRPPRRDPPPLDDQPGRAGGGRRRDRDHRSVGDRREPQRTHRRDGVRARPRSPGSWPPRTRTVIDVARHRRPTWRAWSRRRPAARRCFMVDGMAPRRRGPQLRAVADPRRRGRARRRVRRRRHGQGDPGRHRRPRPRPTRSASPSSPRTSRRPSRPATR